MKRILIALFVAAVVGVGCKKTTEEINKYNPPYGGMISWVKLYEDTTLIKETFHEYDAYNRPVRTYTTDSDFIFYTYAGNTITERYRYHDGFNDEYVYQLNNGRAVTYTHGNGNGTYQYNNFGYLTYAWHFAPSHNYDTTRCVYDNDGNCVFAGYYTSYNIYTFNNYTYNDTLNTVGPANTGITWKGADNKRLVAKDEYIAYFGTSPDTTVTTYTYQLNADRTVSKRQYQKKSRTAIRYYYEVFGYAK